MDSQQLDLFIDPILSIYLDIESELMSNITNRLKTDPCDFKNADLSWQINKLAQINSLNHENLMTISKQSGRSLAELYKTMRNAGMLSAGQYEKALQQAFDNGAELRIPPKLSEDTHVLSVLSAISATAKTTLNLLNASLLNGAAQAYRDIIAKTVAQAASGIITPEKALYRTADEWAARGLPALVDKSGRNWSIEGYVRMVTRTTIQHATNEMQFARMDSWGADLIEVSSHAGARPLCAPYQGRIYSRNGTSSKYPAFSATSYGQKAGLFGINCGHFSFPYVEGVSQQTFRPYPKADNARIYQESQQQRYNERQIRNWKRRQQAALALGDADGAKRAGKKVSEKQLIQREFIKKTGRTRRYNREQVVKF